MVKRNAIATKLTKRCTQTQKTAFDVAVLGDHVVLSRMVETQRLESMRAAEARANSFLNPYSKGDKQNYHDDDECHDECLEECHDD